MGISNGRLIAEDQGSKLQTPSGITIGNPRQWYLLLYQRPVLPIIFLCSVRSNTTSASVKIIGVCFYLLIL